MIDPDRIRVRAIDPPGALESAGLHWFQVLFEARSGRCCITGGEAQHLRQLNTAWVKRALLNLGARHGKGWLEDALVRSPGLLLHHSDAHEPWSRPARPSFLGAEP